MTQRDKKIFATLFFSIFAVVTGVGIVVPLLPVYAHHLGASGVYISLIFGAFSLSRSFFLPYFGRLSDRRGRKPFITLGLLAYALISLAFICTGSVQALVGIRFLQGIASAMIMPVAQAYVGDITPCGKEGVSMGLFNVSIFWGLSVGPLAGGLIQDHFNLGAAFLCMALLSLVGFFLSLFLLPSTRQERAERAVQPPLPLRALLRVPALAALFVFRFFYTACIGIIWGFLPVLADSAFSLSSSAIGVLVMLGVFVSGLVQTPMGYLADRLDRRGLVLAGGGIAAVAVTAFLWVQGFWGLFAVNVLFGLGGGIAMPALMAMAVLQGSRSSAMGTVMSHMTLAHSLGMMTGAFLGGVMMDAFDLRLAFALGTVLLLLGMGAFWALSREAGAGRNSAKGLHENNVTF